MAHTTYNIYMLYNIQYYIIQICMFIICIDNTKCDCKYNNIK